MIPRTHSIPSEERVISVRNLKFVYDGGVEALKGINLDIKKGEFLAIVGGNGSGKTTLAKNFNGLLRPSHGTVTVMNRPAASQTVAELSRVIGYAFQNPDHQLFCSSVEEEVRFGPANLGYSDEEVKRKVEHAIETMDLQSLRGLPPFSLRLGERRRVSIASVIAMDPQIIVLDEPTTGLDAGETKVLMEKISHLNREGRTIVLITHDMRLVAESSSRVVVMSDGRIVLDSDPRGAFADIDLLRNCSLVPPPVMLLAHSLAKYGIPKDIMSPQELVLRIVLEKGGAR
ncbi:MAG: energy-coupling factor ABC transporter ATP-binding protein [Thermoplasmata archaeon]|nr:energy-coupling factor ABC transporter ATP-binding protein [Thermoplasmata archaeon]